MVLTLLFYVTLELWRLDAVMQLTPVLTLTHKSPCLWFGLPSVLVVIWVTWLEHLFNGPISGGNFGNCLISPPGVGLRQIQEAWRHIIIFSSIS